MNLIELKQKTILISFDGRFAFLNIFDNSPYFRVNPLLKPLFCADNDRQLVLKLFSSRFHINSQNFKILNYTEICLWDFGHLDPFSQGYKFLMNYFFSILIKDLNLKTFFTLVKVFCLNFIINFSLKLNLA